jgi:Tfp pilus assembly protein PilF
MKSKIVLSVLPVAVLSVTVLLADNPKPQAEADVAHNTGRTFLEQGHPDLAIEQFKKAISLDSKNYFAYKGLGIAYAQLKDYKEAEKAQRKCLEMNPDFADVHNDLGATLLSMGRRDEGRKEWLSAFASPFNPTPDVTAWNLGNSYLDDGNLADAQHWYEAALAKNDRFAPAHVGLASVMIAQSRVDDAIPLLQKAAKELPDDPSVMVALGDGYFKAGRFAEARTQLELATKRDPSGPTGKRAAEMLQHFPK